MTKLSDYGNDDEVKQDPNDYIVDIIDDLRRDAEGFKLDGQYSQISLKLLAAANAMEDLLKRNDELLNNLIVIEDVVSRALR